MVIVPRITRYISPLARRRLTRFHPAYWLRAAGFDLRTERRDGGQFGFSAAGGRLRGHFDGVIVGGGPDVGIAWPALWEHKALNARARSGRT